MTIGKRKSTLQLVCFPILFMESLFEFQRNNFIIILRITHMSFTTFETLS